MQCSRLARRADAALVRTGVRITVCVRRQIRLRPIAVLLAGSVALAGISACGGSAGTAKSQPPPAAPPTAGQFPKPAGRTLQQLATSAPRGPQVGIATSVFTPGENRVAFGLIDDGQKFVYGQVAIYIARRWATRPKDHSSPHSTRSGRRPRSAARRPPPTPRRSRRSTTRAYGSQRRAPTPRS